MNTFHRLLCPVDYSEPSRRALLHAIAIARRHHSQITVMHVEGALEAVARAEGGLYDQFLPEDALRDFVSTATDYDRQRIQLVSTTGRVVEAIIEQADRGSSDLIVMGTHGRSGAARVLLGSVTERVVRDAHCPVMAVPPAAAIPASGDRNQLEAILCPSDFSRSCSKALKLALSIAHDTNARLVLLHALQWPAFAEGPMPLPVVTQINVDAADWRREALATLERGLPADARARIGYKALVKPGHPSETILQVAQDEHVGLIVMGTQSRSAIDRLLFGSTTREAIQAGRCPVISVRAEKNDPAWIVSADNVRDRVGAR